MRGLDLLTKMNWESPQGQLLLSSSFWNLRFFVIRRLSWRCPKRWAQYSTLADSIYADLILESCGSFLDCSPCSGRWEIFNHSKVTLKSMTFSPTASRCFQFKSKVTRFWTLYFRGFWILILPVSVTVHLSYCGAELEFSARMWRLLGREERQYWLPEKMLGET